jgi:hypothetical protein
MRALTALRALSVIGCLLFAPIAAYQTKVPNAQDN